MGAVLDRATEDNRAAPAAMSSFRRFSRAIATVVRRLHRSPAKPTPAAWSGGRSRTHGAAHPGARERFPVHRTAPRAAMTPPLLQIDDFDLVRFLPLDITRPRSIANIMAHIDNAIQYEEDAEVRIPAVRSVRCCLHPRRPIHHLIRGNGVCWAAGRTAEGCGRVISRGL